MDSDQIRNTQLLEAIKTDATSATEASRKKLYEALVSSMLLLPIERPLEGIESSEGTIERPTAIQFRSGVKSTGERWSAVFTDEEALRAWDSTHPWVGLEARELFTMMLDAGMDEIVINPFRQRPDRPGGILTRREFEMLAAGLIPVGLDSHSATMIVGREASLRIEPPSAPLAKPIAVALAAAAPTLRGLAKIAHCRISYRGAPAHDALVLRCGAGLFPLKCDQVAKRLMDPIQPLMGKADILDILPTDREDHDGFRVGVLVWERSRKPIQ